MSLHDTKTDSLVRSIVCDIEGTTTSLEFAQKTLFPLSYEEMDAFIRKHWNDLLVRNEILSVKAEIARNRGTPAEQIAAEDVIAQLRKWIDEDNKDIRLKTIQGKIWKDAFETGRIRGHVYPDVPEYFRRWYGIGIRISIFSSGSVEAQQMIFRYSESGDLTPHIDRYFDTTIGSKKDWVSYLRIADELARQPLEVLFLSDSSAELDAALQAGMTTVQLVRDQSPPTQSTHKIARSFAEIL